MTPRRRRPAALIARRDAAVASRQYIWTSSVTLQFHFDCIRARRHISKNRGLLLPPEGVRRICHDGPLHSPSSFLLLLVYLIYRSCPWVGLTHELGWVGNGDRL